jgi:hypothetical protein
MDKRKRGRGGWMGVGGVAQGRALVWGPGTIPSTTKKKKN